MTGTPERGPVGPDDALVPGAQVSTRWAAWRATTDLVEYETRWDRLEAEGTATHGEADLVTIWRPTRVLDAGCGMGRVAIELDRRGIEVEGADLDPDLLAVARRHAPHLTWRCADLARDDLGAHYDLVVMAGNVPVFCAPEDRMALVANLAAHLQPGGRLVVGFVLEDGPEAITAADYERCCVAAGLRTEHRWSTWDRDPFVEDGPERSRYLVAVAIAPD
jgi:SAM-dependent methyltransferase